MESARNQTLSKYRKSTLDGLYVWTNIPRRSFSWRKTKRNKLRTEKIIRYNVNRDHLDRRKNRVLVQSNDYIIQEKRNRETVGEDVTEIVKGRDKKGRKVQI